MSQLIYIVLVVVVACVAYVVVTSLAGAPVIFGVLAFVVVLAFAFAGRSRLRL